MSVTIKFNKKKVIFDDLMVDNYYAYLDSEEWKQKRKEVIINADFKCQICNSYIGWSGEIHHSTYNNLFEERDSDLVYCCPVCHPR